jgi:hypothetical protein
MRDGAWIGRIDLRRFGVVDAVSRTDARREDHLVRSLPARSSVSILDVMNEVTRRLGKIEEGIPQAAAHLPGLPPAGRGRPACTGPLKAGTDSREMPAPGRSAVRERPRGV